MDAEHHLDPQRSGQQMFFILKFYISLVRKLLSFGQSYEASAIVNYDPRVVFTRELPLVILSRSFIRLPTDIVKCLPKVFVSVNNRIINR